MILGHPAISELDDGAKIALVYRKPLAILI